MTTTQLKAMARKVKAEIKDWVEDFKAREGRDPEKSDKDAIRSKYEAFERLQNQHKDVRRVQEASPRRVQQQQQEEEDEGPKVEGREAPEGAEEEEFPESLVEAVEEMRGIVETVAEHWRGLGLDFDEDVQVNTSPQEANQKPTLRRIHSNSESMNQAAHDTLDSNEQMLLLQSRMESEMHAIRSEANKRNQEVAEKHRQLEAALAEERRRREVAEAELRAEIEANMVKLKSFLGKVCKKLPRPQRVNVSRKWLGTRVVVKLVFVCPRTDKELEVESSDWSLWLKFAWSIVQAGNPLQLVQDIVGTVDTVRDMVETAYEAYHEVDNAQATLDAMRTDPILLPSEEEKLIQGLRDAKFYDSFTYDDQTAEWFAT